MLVWFRLGQMLLFYRVVQSVTNNRTTMTIVCLDMITVSFLIICKSRGRTVRVSGNIVVVSGIKSIWNDLNMEMTCFVSKLAFICLI